MQSRKPVRRYALGWIIGATLVLIGVWFGVRRQQETVSGKADVAPMVAPHAESRPGGANAAKPYRKQGKEAVAASASAPREAGRSDDAGQSKAPAAPRAADENPLAKLLSGENFALADRGRVSVFELALDELYLPSAPVKERLAKVEAQADAESLIRLAESMKPAEGELPNLVIYPPGQPRNENTRRIVTGKVLMELSDATAAAEIAEAAGARIVSKPNYAPSHVIAEARVPGVASSLEVVGRLAGRKGVVSAEVLLARQQVKRITIPNDTYFPQQWHLRNTGQGGGTVGIDAAVTNVWDTYKGSGVTICVVDDGVQLTHPDIAPNASGTNHYDWNDIPQDTDPAPDASNDDFHGTAVAGVAAARGDNGLGVTGAAPLATIVGFRLIADENTDQDEAEAMALHNDIIQIKNNSWGPPDSQPWELGEAGPLFLAALQDGTTTGRGGNGIIYPWAAGNGRDWGDQSNKDGYANSIHVLAVGALTNTGALSYYSETGSNIVVTAPSDGGPLEIVTTDLVGTQGYNNGSEMSDRDYTNSFGGTSSATPLVSGVVALMLEVNPNLTWRDVKEILLRSSTKVSPIDPNWTTRKVGDGALPPIKHNEQFGGGLVNAQAAVALALNWPARPAMTQMSMSRTYAGAGTSIPDNNTSGVVTTFDFSGQAAMRVEHVEVTLSATHTYRGDLQVLLTSPGGVVSTLAGVTLDDEDGGALQRYDAWTFSSVRHWGESSVGTWRVTVRDLEEFDTGRVQAVSVRLSGMAAPLQDIAVEQPAGTNLEGGVSIVDYGEVAMDNPATKVFTLKNVGDFALTSISTSITGDNADDFMLTVLPPTTLGAAGVTSFSVRFAPSAIGSREATLHIASNDPDEAPFDIPLAGVGTPSVGFLTFGATAYTILETDGPIQVPLTRVGGSYNPGGNPVTADVVTANGSAVAPGDYTALPGELASFNDGVVDGVVAVPIVSNLTTSEANETFTVKLSNPTNGLRLGTPEQVPVTIIDTSALSQTTDLANPGVPAVSSPAEGALLPLLAGDKITVTGTATDNKGVEKVELILNGGTASLAQLSIPGATSTSFQGEVIPITGANVLEVVTTDYSGRTNKRIRKFKATRPLPVHLDALLGSVTVGFAPSSFREVGKSYTITATPKPPTSSPAFGGAIFAGWTLGGQDVAANDAAFTPQRLGMPDVALAKQTITFIFREGLELTANFMPSPFGPMAGTYNGLIRPSGTLPDRAPVGGGAGAEDGSESNLSTEGHFTATLDSKGSFSAKLTIDGLVLTFAGAFDHHGNARFGTSRALTQTVPRPNKPSYTVSLRLTDANGVTAGGEQIEGTVIATEFRRSVIATVSRAVGERAHYGARVVNGDISAGSAAVLLASTTDRSVGELVTGTGIPAGTTVASVNPAQVTLSANATVTKAGASVTFTRNVDAAYMKPANADGYYTTVFPARPPHYAVAVTFDEAADAVFSGTGNLFQDDAVVVFEGALPAPLVAGEEYFVINKSADSFQVSETQGGGPVDIEDAGSGVAVLDPAARQIKAFTVQDYPQGDGVGSLKITKSGMVTFTGTLADGTSVTASSTLSSAGTMPLFARLYGLKGFLSTLVKLKDTPLADTVPDLSPAPESEVLWLRPFLLDQYYPYGWPEVLRLDLEGAKYDATGVVLREADNMPLGAADLSNGNATLTLSDGQLTEDLVKLVSISGTNVVTKLPDSLDPTFTLSITVTTGTFTGVFKHTDDTMPSFQGILLQKGPNAGGHGFFKTKAPVAINYAGESGGVSLKGLP